MNATTQHGLSSAAARASALLSALAARGYDFFTGVPCSLLGALYPLLEAGAPDRVYVEATREDEAIGLAAGAYLAGRKPVVLMQNSGLGNSLNAICSLSQIYRLPALLLVTWRGQGGQDAPEHLVMGRAMTSIFDAIGLGWQVLDVSRLEQQLEEVERRHAAGEPAVLVVTRGQLSEGHP